MNGVSMVDATDCLELAAKLLPFLLHFLITCVMRDNGRATPCLPRQKNKVSIIPNH